MVNRREALKRAGLIGVGRRRRAANRERSRAGWPQARVDDRAAVQPGNDRPAPVPLRAHRVDPDQHLRDAAHPRSQEHGAQAAAGHVVAQRRSAHLGVQAAARREVPQRRAVRRRVGQVQHRPHDRLQAQHARQGAVAAVHRPGGADRRSRHGADHHQGAGSDPAQPRGGGVGEHGAAQGDGRVPREVRERPADRHRAVSASSSTWWASALVLEANPDYWGAKPASQRLVWQIVPDPPRAWPRCRAAPSTSC